jgi:hypothetical protein
VKRSDLPFATAILFCSCIAAIAGGMRNHACFPQVTETCNANPDLLCAYDVEDDAGCGQSCRVCNSSIAMTDFGCQPEEGWICVDNGPSYNCGPVAAYIGLCGGWEAGDPAAACTCNNTMPEGNCDRQIFHCTGDFEDPNPEE